MLFRSEFACPAWCARAHDGQDHPSDRYHATPHVFVPVVVPARSSKDVNAAGRGESAEATEFSVQASQRVLGDSTTWVAIVGEQQYIDVTVESAARLHAALGQLLDKLWRA